MSEKRSYINFLDKTEFPFFIKDGKIKFKKLLSKVNKSNNIRFWKIYNNWRRWININK